MQWEKITEILQEFSYTSRGVSIESWMREKNVVFFEKTELHPPGNSCTILLLGIPSLWASQNAMFQWQQIRKKYVFLRGTREANTSATKKVKTKYELITFIAMFLHRFINFFNFPGKCYFVLFSDGKPEKRTCIGFAEGQLFFKKSSLDKNHNFCREKTMFCFWKNRRCIRVLKTLWKLILVVRFGSDTCELHNHGTNPYFFNIQATNHSSDSLRVLAK